MKTHVPLAAAAALVFLAGCASVRIPAPPRQGQIPDPAGGPPGYQHGAENGKFALGANVRRMQQYGYLKTTGDQGTLAIKQTNGSVVGIPNANAASLRLAPYGSSPADHDMFVRAYFVGLGLPADQVKAVRGMTLLDASGKSDEPANPIPQISAYYSVLERNGGGTPVPDSFAWARANSRGQIVHEGVYWPALPAAVVAEAQKFRELLDNPEQRHMFEARTGMNVAEGSLVIRHAGPSEDRFESFASLDFAIRTAVGTAPQQTQDGARIAGATRVRHFDITGTERFLAQERLDLGDRYPDKKLPQAPERTRKSPGTAP
jgi:hypothetical protein